MRAVELYEAAAPKIGREFNHLEDLVFAEGSAGAQRAFEYVTHMATEAKGTDYSLKWDGNPTVYWGREPDGTFIFVGKNNWDKADQGGFATSPEELKSFIMSRGKGEDWRAKFAEDLADCWHIFEAGTPENFRGYFYGDLLFHPGKPFETVKQQLVFTPNKVTYQVPVDQELGLLLFRAKAAVVVHKYLKRFGDNDTGKMPNLEKFKTSQGLYYPSASSQLAILGPYFADEGAKIDPTHLKQIKQQYMTKPVLAAIDNFLAGVPGLSSPGSDIYTFVNTQSKAGNLEGLAQNFPAWARANLGPKKLAAFAEKIATNPKGLSAMFALIEAIRDVKNDVINQLDQQTPQIRTKTGDESGGEGWVYRDTKLVPRHRWTPN
jgi:hypothetical protein